MAWIESHQDLEKNGKLLELANLLSINKYQAIGHLHSLWWWSLDNAEDGDISRFSSVTVTQACGWSEYIKDEIDLSRINEMTNSDKADGFIPALIECGFLDQKEDGLYIHNWRDYTERYFKSIKANKRIKEQVKERVKKWRNSNASVTQVKRSVTVPTIPNHTLPNHITTKDKSARPYFSKPTPAEVQIYTQGLHLKIDAEAFCDFYEAKGWKIGNSPMKSWQAAARNWARRGNDFGNNGRPIATPAPKLPPPPKDPVIAPEDMVSEEEISRLRRSLKPKVIA